MSKLLFAGSRTDSVTLVSGAISDSTNSIDNAYSDAGININNGTIKVQFFDPASAPLLANYAVEAGNTLYYHFYCGADFSGTSYSGNLVELYDSSGVPWLYMDSGGNWFYNSDTAESVVWSAFGTNIVGAPWLNRGVATVDIQIKIETSGDHVLFMAINGAQAIAPVVFAQPLMTNLSSLTMNLGGSIGGGSVVSQLLATENISTVGGHVQTCRATGAGAHSDWAGTYTDVNETITNLSNYNLALTAGLEQSYPMSNITVPEGSVIQGVFYWLIAKNDGSAPENIASLIRTGAAVDHVSANLNNPSIAFAGLGARYDVNPDTSAAWTQSDWNAPVQLGFVSET